MNTILGTLSFCGTGSCLCRWILLRLNLSICSRHLKLLSRSLTVSTIGKTEAFTFTSSTRRKSLQVLELPNRITCDVEELMFKLSCLNSSSIEHQSELRSSTHRRQSWGLKDLLSWMSLCLHMYGWRLNVGKYISDI